MEATSEKSKIRCWMVRRQKEVLLTRAARMAGISCLVP